MQSSPAVRLLLAAHRPPDQREHQHEHAARLGEKNPAVCQSRSSWNQSKADSSWRDPTGADRAARWKGKWFLALAICALAAPSTYAREAVRSPPRARTSFGVPAPSTAPEPTAPRAARSLPVNALPGWERDGLGGLFDALARQCALRRPPPPWPRLCKDLPALAGGPAALRNWIEARFVAWPLIGPNGSDLGLITGYHEPLLTGSTQRENPSQVALYRRPMDLQSDGTARLRIVDGRREPYPARASIEGSPLLAGQELVWLDDPVEAFFLQVQGSGRVRLRNNDILRVGFADHNGQPYRAIGAELVARGALDREEVDAPAIKAWLRAHPDEARGVMRSNPRYIFFRALATPADAGPPGSMAVPLTPMRSVATDPDFVPEGALLYLETHYPDDGRPLARAMLSQDRGAAIVGGVRADIFFGAGDEAARLAGLMKEPGRIWLLWPRGLPAPGGRTGASINPSSSRPASD